MLQVQTVPTATLQICINWTIQLKIKLLQCWFKQKIINENIPTLNIQYHNIGGGGGSIKDSNKQIYMKRSKQ